MRTRIVDLLRELRHLNNLVGQLAERVETLEDQNLNDRLEHLVQLSTIRSEETDKQLLRLAELVAELSTR